MKLPRTDDGVAVILKLVGEVCNLDCDYCYEKRKPYIGNRLLRPDSVRSLFQSMQPRRLAVELHGGEPLLYPKDKFVELGQVFHELGERLTRITLQTNGTYLDATSIRFLRQTIPQIQIGISCDGPPEMAIYRVSNSGENAGIDAINALDCMASEGVEAGVICVVNKGNVTHAEALLDFFASCKAARALKFVPCFDFNVTQSSNTKRRQGLFEIIDTNKGTQLPWAISPTEYTAFLTEAWNVWRDKRLFQHFLVEPFLSAIQSARGKSTANCHFSSSKCAHVITLYPDETIGSCDELPRSLASYGLQSEFDFSVAVREKWNQPDASSISSSLLAKCHRCSYRESCGGGCIATRLSYAKLDRDEEYCIHRKALMDLISPTTAHFRP